MKVIQSPVLFLLLQVPCSILAASSSLRTDFMDFYDDLSERLACPSPEDYVAENPDFPLECVENSIPPWPLCLFHNVTYFIQGAVASADRCCDFENLEACRCPFKNNQKWQEVMADWCANIETCPESVTPLSATKVSAVDSIIATDVWSKFLLEDFVESMTGLDIDGEESSDEGDEGEDSEDGEDEDFDDEDFDDEYYDE
mmetsp:Transcript_1301/g.2372  ORF Transcript_1301/g.2372 Transcript_1301/m.2372 type:complete len:200 (+) Transcript_1301:221-820(+)|eukprot:CAMPEP_0176487440 /NCGR_PEP_ID=MMETSP0200_2-20121128/6133_1 /TAXON_ID=947934 /ORGANISM="Chaetoceros sp., Strain GSL56" /LENGTH=199 /DNA_ID=CAMNT_0017884269 /DNA_START=213 /DNA_END=812 /DNA_ORIENTATION=-